MEQLKLVGPSSLGVSLLTAAFVGMVFTIQVLLTWTHTGAESKIAPQRAPSYDTSPLLL